MNISILGNGGMSQSIQAMAAKHNHVMSSVLDRDDEWDFQDADVIIECTTPASFLNHFDALCKLNKDLIIVTTGWYDQMEDIKSKVEDAGLRVLWSSNFSVGVHLYFHLIEAASKLMNDFTDYDVWATELHHKNKADSPSGTAMTLSDILLKHIDRKTEVVAETLHRPIKDHELHFSSTRGGAVNFAHTIAFDSSEDVIKMTHEARNRDGYALGVIRAAEWLQSQPKGFYGMEDFMSR